MILVYTDHGAALAQTLVPADVCYYYENVAWLHYSHALCPAAVAVLEVLHDL